MSIGASLHVQRELSRLESFDASTLKTRIHTFLPFGIRGLHGEYHVQTELGLWRVWTQPKHIPPHALEPHLDQTKLTIDQEGFVSAIQRGRGITKSPKRKLLTVEPDRWGRSWRSECYFEIDRFLELGDENWPEKETSEILEQCCVCVNRLLDSLTLAGGAADLPYVLPKDFWSIDLTYISDGQVAGSYSAVGLQIMWWRGPRALPEDKQQAIRETLQAGEIPLHSALLVTARRKLELGDNRGAVIDSICAVESVLGPILTDMLQRAGASSGKISNVLGPSGIGLSDQVYVLLPALTSVPLPEHLRNGFSDANGKRNRIVHKGEHANDREARAALDICTALIGHLTDVSATQGG